MLIQSPPKIRIEIDIAAGNFNKKLRYRKEIASTSTSQTRSVSTEVSSNVVDKASKVTQGRQNCIYSIDIIAFFSYLI